MYVSRLRRFQEILKSKKLPAFLISHPTNIFYLTGFSLPSAEKDAFMLVTPQRSYFFTDLRYETAAKQQLDKDEIELLIVTPQKKLSFWLNSKFRIQKISRCCFEANNLTFTEYQILQKKCPEITFYPSQKIVEELREIKDKHEEEYLRKACNLTNKCLTEIIPTVRCGETEIDIQRKISRFAWENDCQLAFRPIVAIGTNSALPHYFTPLSGPTKSVTKNSVVLLDFGFRYNSYVSDITRMIVFGKPKTDFVNVYNLLLKIQQQLVASINKVADVRELALICQHELKIHGLPPLPHSLGHGVGLDVHEKPTISIRSRDKIRAGQILTIEPAAYFPDRFGIRIEDTILINQELNPEILTSFSKKLVFI